MPGTAAVEPVSPELALVCDELRARARAALPDRPWEQFAPGRTAPRAAQPLQEPAAIPPAIGVPPAPARSRPAARAASRAVGRRLRQAVGIAALSGLVSLLVVGSLPYAHDAPQFVIGATESAPSSRDAAPAGGAGASGAPSSAPESAPKAGRTAPPTAAKPKVAGPAASKPKGAGSDDPKAGAKPDASTPERPKPVEASRKPAPSTPPAALGGSGYVAAGVVRFRTGDEGRRILDVVVTTRCGTVSHTRPFPIAPAGTFTLTTDGRTSVRLVGTFAQPTLARGVVRVRAPGCDTGALPFAASLS